MPNVAFHHEVLSAVRKNSSAPPLPAGGNPMYTELGAIGPDIYKYIPVSTKLAKALKTSFETALTSNSAPDITPITSDANLGPELQRNPMMAIYSLLCEEIVIPFWGNFHSEAANLAKLAPIAAAQDGNALKALGGLVIIDVDAKHLAKLTASATVLMQMVPLLLEFAPPIEAPSSDPSAKPWDPATGRPAEFLRWHHTNKLAQELVTSAGSPDENAYAYGYMCHIAGAVCGEPFINNIVGGPYRTHWWRNRFVSNFVDSWTFGRYEPPTGTNPQASMSGDTPTPIYANWPDITQSNLQAHFDIAGLTPSTATIPDAVRRVAAGLDAIDPIVTTLPAEVKTVMQYIDTAIKSSYPALTRPAEFIVDPVSKALVGLYGVVWVMTSGFTTPPPLPAPGSAGSTNPPSWVTSGGGGGTPPPPVQGGPSTGATVCGVLLAILAGLSFLTGNFAVGAGALVGAIAEFESGHGIDWDALQSDVFWLTSILQQIQQGLFKTLAIGGLGYPMPSMLGGNSSGSWQPVTSSMLGLTFGPQKEQDNTPLTRINPSRKVNAAQVYPMQMDQTAPAAGSSLTADSFYQFYPGLLSGDNTAVEQPAIADYPPQMTVSPSDNYELSSLYPEIAVDQSPAKGVGLFSPVTFPSSNLYFGDAVSNSLLLLKDGPAKLPDYNLDGDRGYGWLNWNPQAPKIIGHQPGNYPSSGTVAVVKEL